MDFQLQNKIVFVSGSYRGTGHTIAERFVSEGARVIVHAHNPDQLATLDLSPFAGSVVGDLGTQAGMAAVVDQIVKEFKTGDFIQDMKKLNMHWQVNIEALPGNDECWVSYDDILCIILEIAYQ